MNAILSVTELYSGYGDVPALEDVSLEVREGEIVSVVGANGAGKTTLLTTIAGLLRARSGRVSYRGLDLTSLPAQRIAESGIAMVPEGGRLFPFMTISRKPRTRSLCENCSRRDG